MDLRATLTLGAVGLALGIGVGVGLAAAIVPSQDTAVKKLLTQATVDLGKNLQAAKEPHRAATKLLEQSEESLKPRWFELRDTLEAAKRDDTDYRSLLELEGRFSAKVWTLFKGEAPLSRDQYVEIVQDVVTKAFEGVPGLVELDVTAGAAGVELLITMNDRLTQQEMLRLSKEVLRLKKTKPVGGWIATVRFASKSAKPASVGPLAKLGAKTLWRFVHSFFSAAPTLPNPATVRKTGRKDALWMLKNSTVHELRVTCYGPAQLSFTIPAGRLKTVELLPGTYFVRVETARQTRVVPLKGRHGFAAGYLYSNDYTIVTQRKR